MVLAIRCLRGKTSKKLAAFVLFLNGLTVIVSVINSVITINNPNVVGIIRISGYMGLIAASLNLPAIVLALLTLRRSQPTGMLGSVKSRITIFIIIFICLLASILGRFSPAATDEIFWQRQQNGYFFTTDLERALKKTQFPALFPGYLPNLDGTEPRLYVRGSVQADNFIEFQYVWNQGTKDARSVKIEEFKSTASAVTSDAVIIWGGFPRDWPHHIVEIAGEEVIVQENWGNDLEWAYHFETRGIQFHVYVSGFPEGEVAKIVESIISSSPQG